MSAPCLRPLCLRAATLFLAGIVVGANSRAEDVPQTAESVQASRARAAAAAAGASAKDAALARDVALRALDNALARQRAGEDTLVLALRDSGPDALADLEKKVVAAVADTRAARLAVAKVREYCDAVAAAEAAALAATRVAVDKQKGRDAENAARTAEKQAKAARESSLDAAKVACELKRRWLDLTFPAAVRGSESTNVPPSKRP
jgi:hypothetical protein